MATTTGFAAPVLRQSIRSLDMTWSIQPLTDPSVPAPPSPPRLGRRSTLVPRSVGAIIATGLSSLGKRSRDALDAGTAALKQEKRELRHLRDTNEYAGIDTVPVVYSVWRKGKLVPAAQAVVAPSACDSREPTACAAETSRKRVKLVQATSNTGLPKTGMLKTATPNTVSPKTGLLKTGLPKTSSTKTFLPKHVLHKTPIIETAPPKAASPKAVASRTSSPRKVQKSRQSNSHAGASHFADAGGSLADPVPTPVKRFGIKKHLPCGLLAGQDLSQSFGAGLSSAERKLLAQIPELSAPAAVNNMLSLPMLDGARLLLNGRDFKLPYDVCHPLPPGQPKPDEWRKMTKNRFIGAAKDYWRKRPHFNDFQSKCVCLPSDGCREACQNRTMLYECDATNCNVGVEYCSNRAFAELQERRALGNKYQIGVEVIKTADRGFGVRSNRCFEPGQIIIEYTGEIITEEECERRMREEYHDNERNSKCYYLMSFDQNTIIDATAGSVARFVNHSCKPNCRMVKWIVTGQPRMALFAGDRSINTGDELTYDYNFDPFSSQNVQRCLCGESNCRGVLGPRTRDLRPTVSSKNKAARLFNVAVLAGKRKFQEMIAGGEGEDKHQHKKDGDMGKLMKTQSVARRKILPALGIRGAIKGAVTAVADTAKISAESVSGKMAATKHKSEPKHKRELMSSKTSGSATAIKPLPRKLSKKQQKIMSNRRTSEKAQKKRAPPRIPQMIIPGPLGTPVEWSSRSSSLTLVASDNSNSKLATEDTSAEVNQLKKEALSTPP